MIYLDVTPENCHDRMINIRKRECEKNVPLTYLQSLDKCYKELL